MNDISKEPTVNLIQELTYIDQEIEMMYIKRAKKEHIDKKKLKGLIRIYEQDRKELVKRFPFLEKSEEFQPIRKRRVIEYDEKN